MTRTVLIAICFLMVTSVIVSADESSSGKRNQQVIDLIPIATKNTPDLEPGRICTNAQPEYRKAKWKVVIGGDPARTATVVRKDGPVDPPLGYNHKKNGDIIEFTWDGKTTGEYKLIAWVEQDSSISVTKSEQVFEFTLTVNSETEAANLDVTANAVDLVKGKVSQPNTMTKSVVAATNPPGLFSKKLKASSIGCYLSGHIWCGRISRNSVNAFPTDLASGFFDINSGTVAAMSCPIPASGDGARAGATVRVTLSNSEVNTLPDVGTPGDCAIKTFVPSQVDSFAAVIHLDSVLAPKPRTFDFSAGRTKIYAYGARGVYAGAANGDFSARSVLVGGVLSVSTDVSYFIIP